MTRFRRFHYFRRSFSLFTVAALAVLPSIAIPTATQAATCRSTDTACLQAAQKAAQAAAAAAAAAAKQQQQVAADAAAKIQQTASQITTLQASLQQTQTQITSTQGQIDAKNQQIADQESTLSRLQTQLNAMVREMWVSYQSMPDDLSLYSGNSISASTKTQADFMALKKSVAAVYSQTQDAESQVTAARDLLSQQSQKLQTVQSQQSDQKIALASVKQSQQALQQNATAAAAQLNAQAVAEQAQANKYAQQVSILQTANFVGSGGGDLITTDPSWYRTQVGDPTHLGNTQYTVGEVGCLITSISMIATFYGNSTTPDYIARNGYFTSQGYYTSGTPAGLGITVGGSNHINWSAVTAQIEAGDPVILGLYESQVGSLNSDGSSHYVVGYAINDAGKVIVADPMNNPHGYLKSQVVAYRIVTKN